MRSGYLITAQINPAISIGPFLVQGALLVLVPERVHRLSVNVQEFAESLKLFFSYPFLAFQLFQPSLNSDP
jgi:hypothetical protein